MTYGIIVPAKWSVPNWDILQPAGWLWAAAQNIRRLFSEFMQHMFSYKLNSEGMCICNRVMLTTAIPVTNYNDLPLIAECLVDQLYTVGSNHMCSVSRSGRMSRDLYSYMPDSFVLLLCVFLTSSRNHTVPS